MTESKVVPFARSASFLHARAMKQKRAGNLLDALELLRRATEAAPQGEGYWLDMAAVYADMHCFFDSRRMALMHLFHRAGEAECFYWLAKYDAELGDLDEARRAYARYLSAQPEGELAEDARTEIESIDASNVLWHQVDRQSRRRVRRLKRVRHCQLTQDYAGADQILAREQEAMPEDQQMRVSRALNLYMMGDEDGARALIDQVQDVESLLPGTVIMAAQVYQRLKRPERAMQLLNGLDRQEMGPSELRMMLYLLTDMGENARAFQVGRELLKQFPYDRQLLHMMALNAVRQGLDAEVAAGFWQRIARMNPEDEVARWYLNELREGRLKPKNVNDGYQLPRRELVRRSQHVLLMLLEPEEQVAREWREDEKTRSVLRWAVATEIPQLVEPALRLLTIAGGEEAWQQMLEFVARTHLGFEFDFRAAGRIGPQDHWSRAGIQEYMKMKYITPDYRSLLNEFDVGRRQMIRMADDVLREEYGIRADVDLAVMWKRVERFAGDVPVVRDLRCGAAALAMNALRQRKVDVTARTLARQCQCSERKLEYYAEWIRGAMDARGENETLGFF